jgi:hypothetical protein
MSPIVQSARQRLELFVRAHQLPENYPTPTQSLLRTLIDELIQAVRAEWPSDSPF